MDLREIAPQEVAAFVQRQCCTLYNISGSRQIVVLLQVGRDFSRDLVLFFLLKVAIKESFLLIESFGNFFVDFSLFEPRTRVS